MIQSRNNIFDILITRNGTRFDLSIIFALDWTETVNVNPNANASDWHVYGPGSIISCKTTDDTYNGSTPCIGAAPAQSMTCRLLADGTRIAPRNGAPCWARLDAIATDGNVDRIFYGPYTVDSVSYDLLTNCYDVVATGPMARTDDDYHTFTDGLWAPDDSEALDVIAETMTYSIPGVEGLEGDTADYLEYYSREHDTMMRPPDGTTGRDLIQWMAGAVGGNAKIRFSGIYTAPNDANLVIIQHPFGGNNSETISIGENYGGAQVAFGFGVVNGNRQAASEYLMHCRAVTFENTADGETHRAVGTLAAGTEELTMRNWVTDPSYAAGVVQYKYDPEVAYDATTHTASVYGYVPFALSDCIIDPRAEAGDRLVFVVNAADGIEYTFHAVIGGIERDLTRGGLASISAPAPSKTVTGPSGQSSNNRNTVSTYGSIGNQREATATVERNGLIRPDGTSVTVDDDGTLHSSAATIATTQHAGIVKPDGTSITVDQDGTIHGVAATIATTQQAGIVKPDGTSITVDQDGTIHGATVAIATTQQAGIVKPDGTSVTVDQDGTIHATGGGGSSQYINEYTPSGGDKGIGIFDPSVSTTDALEHVRYYNKNMYLYGLDNIDPSNRRRPWLRLTSHTGSQGVDKLRMQAPASEASTKTGDARIDLMSGVGSSYSDAGRLDLYANNTSDAAETVLWMRPTSEEVILDFNKTSVGSGHAGVALRQDDARVYVGNSNPENKQNYGTAYLVVKPGATTLCGSAGYMILNMNTTNGVILQYDSTHYIKIDSNGVHINDGNGERPI